LALLLQLLQKEVDGIQFRSTKLEVFGDVTLRDDKHMIGRCRGGDSATLNQPSRPSRLSGPALLDAMIAVDRQPFHPT
jgi:hypothetical protein